MHRARRTRIFVLGSPGLRSRLASEVETSRGVREVGFLTYLILAAAILLELAATRLKRRVRS